jgi:hypothetical protein
MSLDFSEIMIGPPEEVMERLAPRLGELNFASANLKLGVSDDPQQTWRDQGGELAWPLLKLLYLTHSPAQARRMAGLLRAWDAKLFLYVDLEDEEGPPPLACGRAGRRGGPGRRARQAASFYAFALIR